MYVRVTTVTRFGHGFGHDLTLNENHVKKDCDITRGYKAGVVKLVNTRDLKGVPFVVQVTSFLLNLFNQFNNLVDIISVRTFLSRCNGVTMS